MKYSALRYFELKLFPFQSRFYQIAFVNHNI